MRSLRHRIARWLGYRVWMPIAVAPKETALLVAEPGCGMAICKLWADGSWRDDSGGFMHPTHWMPLPEWPIRSLTKGGE